MRRKSPNRSQARRHPSRFWNWTDCPTKATCPTGLRPGARKSQLIELAQAAPEWEPSNDSPETDGDEKPTARRRKSRPVPPDHGGPLSPFDDEGQTDLSNARRFVTMHGQIVRFCAPQGVWYVWNGKQWREDETGEVVRLAKQVSLHP